MKRPFVLLDRDGTIMFDRHYLGDPAGVELLPGAVDGLRRLRELGCGLVIVTNQSGIGRGKFDEPAFRRVDARLAELLALEGLTLDGMFFCPHVSDDACRCRKPSPGMAEQAAEQFGFDFATTFVVGDREGDIGLARAVGARAILVRTGVGAETERLPDCRPDYVADDLRDAAEWIAAKLNLTGEA